MQDSDDQVTKIYQHLKDAGIEVGSKPRTIGRDLGFYFTFDSIMIEVGLI